MRWDHGGLGSPECTCLQPGRRARGASAGPHLSGHVLIGTILQQKLDDFQVILLCRHVQGSEAFLQMQSPMPIECSHPTGPRLHTRLPTLSLAPPRLLHPLRDGQPGCAIGMGRRGMGKLQATGWGKGPPMLVP